LNHAVSVVREKGGAALDAGNRIQSRQHGRDSVYSLTPAGCQGSRRKAEHI
jgi:hypothetical protein